MYNVHCIKVTRNLCNSLLRSHMPKFTCSFDSKIVCVCFESLWSFEICIL